MKSFQRLDELYNATVTLPPERRAEYLDAHCSDPGLRAELERMLAHEHTRVSFADVIAAEANQLAEVMRAARIGARVGNHVIEHEIGRGGMGTVYRARHAALGRGVAIKILHRQFSMHADIVQRFFQEARAATEIDHLGVVEIYDSGTLEDGAAFIIMELLEGHSLAAYLRARALTHHEALRMIAAICAPLGAAHDHGIVHRDLKPDNVFVVPDPEVRDGYRVKLLDFGIAKMAHSTALRTKSGQVMGTPMYMSPEQCRGVAIDRRSDFYSLGCILYELLAGTPPFSGSDILGGHMYEPPPPIRGVDEVVGEVVARLLAKSPDDRPQTAREVVELIERTHAPAVAPRRKRAWVVLPTAAIVGGIAIAVAATRAHTPARIAAPRDAVSDAPMRIDAMMAAMPDAQLDAATSIDAPIDAPIDARASHDATIVHRAIDAAPDAAVEAKAIDAAARGSDESISPF